MNYTRMSLKLRSPTGKFVDGEIIVRDNFAMVKFNEPNLAKQLYELERKTKKELCSYNEEHSALIKHYPNTPMAQIVEDLKKELAQTGTNVSSEFVKESK